LIQWYESNLFQALRSLTKLCLREIKHTPLTTGRHVELHQLSKHVNNAWKQHGHTATIVELLAKEISARNCRMFSLCGLCSLAGGMGCIQSIVEPLNLEATLTLLLNIAVFAAHITFGSMQTQ